MREYLRAIWGGIGGLILLLLVALVALTMEGR
jgi:hypothetical protein